jgi:hypothetical protein
MMIRFFMAELLSPGAAKAKAGRHASAFVHIRSA